MRHRFIQLPLYALRNVRPSNNLSNMRSLTCLHLCSQKNYI
jgi:hypothetical protein